MGGQTTPLSKLLGAQDTLVLQDNQVWGSTRGGEGKQDAGVPLWEAGFPEAWSDRPNAGTWGDSIFKEKAQ